MIPKEAVHSCRDLSRALRSSTRRDPQEGALHEADVHHLPGRPPGRVNAWGHLCERHPQSLTAQPRRPDELPDEFYPGDNHFWRTTLHVPFRRRPKLCCRMPSPRLRICHSEAVRRDVGGKILHQILAESCHQKAENLGPKTQTRNPKPETQKDKLIEKRCSTGDLG